MNNKICIKRNSDGDTRTVKSTPSYEDFHKANINHIHDVNNIMELVSNEIYERGAKHDFTKLEQEELFYNDFLTTINTGKQFTSGEWHKMHIATERHHLNNRCPEDVDLIDVIEMISDYIAAGLARSGNIVKLNLSNELLQKAVNNTIEKLKENIIVEE